MDILTPGQVRLVRRHTSVPQQEALCDSHEALREQLAEALGTTYCAYCGASFPLDAPNSSTLVTEHIYTCPKHPMRDVEKQLAEAQDDVWAAAEAITGVLDGCPENCEEWLLDHTLCRHRSGLLIRVLSRFGVKRVMEEQDGS